MNSILWVVALGALGCGVLLLVAALARVSDAASRLVVVDALAACAVAGCVLAGAKSGETAYLDVAIGFSLAAFLATIAWARTLERPAGASGPPRRRTDAGSVEGGPP